MQVVALQPATSCLYVKCAALSLSAANNNQVLRHCHFHQQAAAGSWQSFANGAIEMLAYVMAADLVKGSCAGIQPRALQLGRSMQALQAPLSIVSGAAWTRRHWPQPALFEYLDSHGLWAAFALEGKLVLEDS